MNTPFIPQQTLLVNKHYLQELAPLSKTYQKGDTGDEVIRIKEWLSLWQLNINDVEFVLDIKNQEFDEPTQKAALKIQKFLGIRPTGIMDHETWQTMVRPLRQAFSLNYFNKHKIRERFKYFATNHLQFRASELAMNNNGPWVRSYMGGHEGTAWAWCQGFVCTLLDQLFSSFNRRFNQYYLNTVICEENRKHARDTGLLVTKEELYTRKYLPQIGDMVLFINKKEQEAHHIEIIYEILNHEQGAIRTIGGNTNFNGTHEDGIGVFLVDRNYLNESKDMAIEIVKLVEMNDQNNKDAAIPIHAKKIIDSYPEFALRYEDNHLIWKDGTKLLFDDHKKKSPLDLLSKPTISDQFHYPYHKGKPLKHPAYLDDPGRITNEPFFQKMYGQSKEEVENHLVEVVWCPKQSGQKIRVTRINGVDKKIQLISAEIDQYPHLQPYVHPLGGDFCWRNVAGTHRLSLHSYGIAIDINTQKSNYWKWDYPSASPLSEIGYVNHIPALLVDIFEKHGFIWGGKWYHYDTMHFEYRPELL